MSTTKKISKDTAIALSSLIYCFMESPLYGNFFEIFNADADYQRSISFSILQIGELSGGLSEEYRKETANRVQWGPIKGMRNLVAHNYGNMSREIIWETATVDIPVLESFCNEQLESCE